MDRWGRRRVRNVESGQRVAGEDVVGWWSAVEKMKRIERKIVEWKRSLPLIVCSNFVTLPLTL